MMKYTKPNPHPGKIHGPVYEATILDMNDGTYAISWPWGWEDDEYAFKTLKGAQRRLERHGFKMVEEI